VTIVFHDVKSLYCTLTPADPKYRELTQDELTNDPEYHELQARLVASGAFLGPIMVRADQDEELELEQWWARVQERDGGSGQQILWAENYGFNTFNFTLVLGDELRIEYDHAEVHLGA
jgi:hypothetical protein